MDPEKLAVELRPRRGWEAVDLGLGMVRAWWRPVYLPWLAIALPAALLLTGALGFFGLLLFWWLLPLFEPVAVLALGRAVFGAPPTLRASLRAWPKAALEAVPELFIRRFVPARAARLPIRQLEGLHGIAWGHRARALSVAEHSPGLLPPIFVVFELALAAALYGLVTLLVPSFFGIDWELLTEQAFAGTLPIVGYRVIAATATLPILLLHPLYLGAGFSLYIDARTRLEGWDLEVGFRKLRRRLVGRARAALRLLVTLGMATLLASTPTSHAAQEAQAPAEEAPQSVEETSSPAEETQAPAPWNGKPSEDPRTVIAEVMTRPELETEEAVEGWRMRTSGEIDGRGFIFLGALITAIARPLLWILGGLLLLVLLRAAWRAARERAAEADRPEVFFPERLAGIELRPDALPDDIAGAARALWRDGDGAAALSLLYRGALTRLIRDGLSLRESFTEDDCLRAARDVIGAEKVAFLDELTRAWQQVAYAHRAPAASTAETLFENYPRHFGPRHFGPAGAGS